MVRITRPIRRWVLIPLSVLLALALVAGGIGFWAVQRAFPQVDGELAVPGLENEVTVYRDGNGIPQIYADTAEDLFKAQGYVHAQDRFWQMHFNRMTTSGRLAEMFGEEQVETDVYLRTMGWRRVAEQEYDLLEPETRAYLDAYADGVNAYLAGRDGGELGLEFSVLAALAPDHGVEEWTPTDSLAWLKAMAWDLRGNMEDEIERASLLASGLDRGQVEELYPDYPEDEHPPIVDGDGEDGDGGGDGEGREEDGADESLAPAAPLLQDVGAGLESVPSLLGPAGPGLGSNSWVVSGDHTASGLPVLANDPHLGPQMPSVWYQTGLHCTDPGEACPFDVTGFSFAGLPGIVIGHNADIAWGFTNLGPDVADLYLERIEDGAAIVDGGLEPLETREETVQVAGGEPVDVTVRSTRHGPVLSDAEAALDLRGFGEAPPVDADGEQVERAGAKPEDGGYAVSLSWTALTPGTTADAIFSMSSASDFEEFRDAARSFEVPAQNLIYADTSGTIGYQAPGTIPVRGKGDGRWPAPGWDSSYDWEGFIDFDDLPSVRDPESGVIVTANQAAAGSDYPHFLTEDWDYGYRAARIHELLQEEIDAGTQLTPEDMVRLQMDNANLGAREVVPYLVDLHLGSPPEEGADPAAAQALLADWDMDQDADSAAAAFYNAVWSRMLDLTFDELPEEYPMDGSSRGWLVMSRLLEDPDSPWWEGEEADGRDAVLAEAMRRAAAELSERFGDDPSEWRWGAMHTLTPTHPSLGTSGIGPVEWVFNGSPVETSGGSSTVNATGWDHTEGYAVTWVPSMRMAVDMADPDTARWIDLTGPSGHAFHPDRGSQTDAWAAGETVPMPFTREAVEKAAENTLVLTP
ncbi:penicillin acylase family protein [Nocardiopsis sp. RSe5-2]|uniref:Penicillin acylase family protein n=1 Tax=Nocardiopsis endophytica TaxID=3018445 RepID=A0ABT4U1T8_9ACTN|nr:penicillin acylase family protein [Nocardiopsis endophytica]MDA2810666.1 penicillin acylase family protein [Nocardiopsis endophytica]